MAKIRRSILPRSRPHACLPKTRDNGLPLRKCSRGRLRANCATAQAATVDQIFSPAWPG
jgi:hypothetical protein